MAGGADQISVTAMSKTISKYMFETWGNIGLKL